MNKQSNKQLIILCGYPASGKSTNVSILENACILSRDQLRGTYKGMLKILDKHKTEQYLVLDNMFLTKQSREPFIDWGNKNGFNTQIISFDTIIEDCLIRHLIRMYNKYMRIYYKGEGPIDDPSMYGPVVLFRSRKEFERPTKDDNNNVDSVTYIRQPHPYANTKYKNKAIFFDLDGTLQNYENKEPFTDISIMKNKLAMFNDMPLIIVTNQSGIYKGDVSEHQIQEQIKNLEDKLNVKFTVHICPHKASPIECFCRKPQSGFAVEEIERLKLNPHKCIMIGDKTTDKTFALRVGMLYMKPEEFWQ